MSEKNLPIRSNEELLPQEKNKRSLPFLKNRIANYLAAGLIILSSSYVVPKFFSLQEEKDRDKISTFFEDCKERNFYSQESAREYFVLAQEIKDNFFMARMKRLEAVALRREGKYKEAESVLMQAFSFAEFIEDKISKSEEIKAIMVEYFFLAETNQIAVSLDVIRDYMEAFIAIDSTDFEGISDAYNNVAMGLFRFSQESDTKIHSLTSKKYLDVAKTYFDKSFDYQLKYYHNWILEDQEFKDWLLQDTKFRCTPMEDLLTDSQKDSIETLIETQKEVVITLLKQQPSTKALKKLEITAEPDSTPKGMTVNAVIKNKEIGEVDPETHIFEKSFEEVTEGMKPAFR